MRGVQFRLLKNVLEKYKIPSYIYGFEKNKSISNMAQIHVGKDVVVSLDIQDFFGSIHVSILRQFFEAQGVGPAPTALISELCTYKYYVPQGSLTAPKISNLITASTFGPDIAKYCEARGMDLTIYADDITVSYNQKDRDNLEENKRVTKELIRFIINTLRKYRFKVNARKTKIMLRGGRQWVCGAVVNQKVNMLKAERHKLRAIVHNTEKNGVEAEAHKTKMTGENFIRKYAGKINWLVQLNPSAGQTLKTRFRAATAEYLRKYPEIQINELSWNSGIESLDEIELQELQEVRTVPAIPKTQQSSVAIAV